MSYIQNKSHPSSSGKKIAFFGLKLVAPRLTNAALSLGNDVGQVLEKDFVNWVCWVKLSTHSKVVYIFIGLGWTLQTHEFTLITSHSLLPLSVENKCCQMCRGTYLDTVIDPLFQSHILPPPFHGSEFPRNIFPLQGRSSKMDTRQVRYLLFH